MPFGMKNSQAKFQHLMNNIISGLEGCESSVVQWGRIFKEFRRIFQKRFRS
jgi:hypothetical protein